MKRILFLTVAVFLIAFVHAFAQDTLPKFDTIFEGSDSDVASRLLTWFNAAMIVVTFFVTYVSSKIPILNQITNKAWRAALISILIGAVFYRLGADGLGVVVSFLTIANPYELLLKPTIGKTPEAQPAQVDEDDNPFA